MSDQTPQTKKRLSYAKDCRNAYGENSKASRKNVPLRRALKHRDYRRTVRQALVATLAVEKFDGDAMHDGVAVVRRDEWEKVSDIPLSLHIEHQRARRAVSALATGGP